MSKLVLHIPFAPILTQSAVLDFVKSSGWAWWHWGAATWLLAIPEQIDAGQLMERVSVVVPGTPFTVLSLRVEVPQSGVNWALWGPQEWEPWFPQWWET